MCFLKSAACTKRTRSIQVQLDARERVKTCPLNQHRAPASLQAALNVRSGMKLDSDANMRRNCSSQGGNSSKATTSVVKPSDVASSSSTATHHASAQQIFEPCQKEEPSDALRLSAGHELSWTLGLR